MSQFVLGGGDGRRFVREVLRFSFSSLAWVRVPGAGAGAVSGEGAGLAFPRADFSVTLLPASCSLDPASTP